MKKNILLDRSFEFVQRSIDGEKTIFSSFTRAFLWFFSLFYKTAVFCKNSLYDFKLLKPKKVKPYVISIGNIVAGGTGKTPFTIYLAKYFLKNQKKVAIISRGYRGKVGNQNIVLCKKENKTSNADIVGDEPALISNRLSDVYVIVGKNKLLSAKIAEELKVDVIILDDGFQHRRLYRDLDLVLIDETTPYSNSHFLPRGYLRDFPKRLKAADLVIVSNCKNNKSADDSRVHTKPSYTCLKDLEGKAVDLFEKKIGVFCAIARPKFFVELLKDLGYEVVMEHFEVDHACFDEDLLKKIALRAKDNGAEGLVCTEKDFIKLSSIKTILPIYYLEIDIEIISGEEKLIKVVAKSQKELL